MNTLTAFCLLSGGTTYYSKQLRSYIFANGGAAVGLKCNSMDGSTAGSALRLRGALLPIDETFQHLDASKDRVTRYTALGFDGGAGLLDLVENHSKRSRTVLHRLSGISAGSGHR